MTVAAWGTGKPDYYKGVSPAKTIVAPNQERFNYSSEGVLPAQTDTGLITIYTVPAGRQLNITFWKASCNKPGLVYGYLYNSGTFYGRATVNEFGTGSTGESGAYVWTAGEAMQYRILNPLSEAASFAYRLAGTFTKV